MYIDFKKIRKELGLREPIEPHATINGQEVDFRFRRDQSVTLEEWENTRGNTPGLRALHPKLNNQALIKIVENYLKNCSVSDDCTYDGALINSLAPLVIKRLGEYTLLHKVNVCVQCKKELNEYNVARRDDGKIRYDSQGFVWCKECTDKFDQIDHSS